MPAVFDKSSFSAGELDAALHARVDLQRHQAGLKICENFAVMVEGGVTRTPGTAFVQPLRDESEAGLLMPFEFSVDDAYLLAFNDGKMRVYRDAGVVEASPGVPYELTTPFVAAELRDMSWAQSADVVFIARNGPPQVLTRIAANNWSIADYVNLRGPIEPQNTDTSKTLTASARTGSGVTITASSALFEAGHVGSIWRLDESNISNVPRWVGNETSLTTGALRRNAGIVYRVVSGTDAGPNPPQHEEGTVLSGQGKVAWAYEHSGFGYFKITGFTSATVVTADVVQPLPHDVVSGTGASYRWYEGAWSPKRGWPTKVLLHDNGLCWARGDKFWRTRLNDFYDFAVSAEDDSGIATRLTPQDGRLVDIQWMLNAGPIVLGTRSGEWMLRGPAPYDPITLANVRAIPNGTEGSAPHRPQAVDGGAVFIGRSQQRLHYAEFDPLSEKIKVGELTLYARNILRGKAVALAYQRDPHRIVWIVQNTGELVAITFRPDQEVQGWSRHPMINGFVEDVAVIASPDASYSQLWIIVRRVIGGVTRRYIEVMKPFFQPLDPTAPTAAGAWFVQSGLRYVGAPATVISGLGHLVGQTVAVMADGIEHRRLVVSAGGSVTLDRACSDVVVGLPIKGRVRTLSYETEINGASTKGRRKRASHVLIERLYSTGGEISVNDGTAEGLLKSGHRVLTANQPLLTGAETVTAIGPHADTLECELVCDDVYPYTLLALGPALQMTETG